MRGRKHNRPVSPYGSAKGHKPRWNGPETFADKAAEKKEPPAVTGGKARMRLDRPGRKRGGRVGCDAAPLSSAAKEDDGEPRARGGRLTARERNALPKSDFAVPNKRAYPVNDKSHARAALSMVAAHGTEAEKKAVRSKAARKYPGIEQSK